MAVFFCNSFFHLTMLTTGAELANNSDEF